MGWRELGFGHPGPHTHLSKGGGPALEVESYLKQRLHREPPECAGNGTAGPLLPPSPTGACQGSQTAALDALRV